MLETPPTDRENRPIPYFDEDDPAFQLVQKIVLDQKWLLSMKHYVHFRYVVLK